MTDLSGVQTYHCREYETVPVPMDELIGPNGEVRFFPEVNNGRYFDVDYAHGQLFLRSKGIVGLIPVSERVAVHVRPRAPISNLLYMTWRAGMKPKSLTGFIRSYQVAEEKIEFPEDLYLNAFQDALKNIDRVGPLRRYRERTNDRELRGRFLVNPTVTRLRAKGVSHRAVFSVNEHTVDNPENRILKYVVERLLRHVRERTDADSRANFAKLRKSLEPFSMVDSTGIDPTYVSRMVPRLIRSLPKSHACYEAVLWLCHLISTHSGVLMERVGNNRFETLLIDVGIVFENYVRRVCEDYANEHLGSCRVFNGNHQSVYLFVDNKRHTTHPDYYFRRGTSHLALADAKYKRRIEAADRYELLGFCEALQVDLAAFVCPKSADVAASAIHGTTARGRKLFVLPIDLNTTDFPKEEERFAKELGSILALNSKPI